MVVSHPRPTNSSTFEQFEGDGRLQAQSNDTAAVKICGLCDNVSHQKQHASTRTCFEELRRARIASDGQTKPPTSTLKSAAVSGSPDANVEDEGDGDKRNVQ